MILAECLDLEGFGSRANIQARHRQYNWENAWSNILQIALYQRGPEVSEVGSSWLENLKDMSALRPFLSPEIKDLGSESAFLSKAWYHDIDSPEIAVSIPWILDTRLFLYRRDLLAQAGILEAGAFATPEAVYDTLARLQASGIAYPLTLATSGLAIHNLASWVWGRGGAFRTIDFHKISLVEPEARQGLADFFGLHRFISPEEGVLDYCPADRRFFNGQAAVLFSGQWTIRVIKDHREGVAPIVWENLGCAMPPGVPYVGSTHLVIWRHSLREREALQLIQFLTSSAVLRQVFALSGNFPALLPVLAGSPFTDDADYQVVCECLRQGRAFRTSHFWAGIEMRMNNLFNQLWRDLFANPDLDLEVEIEHRVRKMADRVEKTLLANR